MIRKGLVAKVLPCLASIAFSITSSPSNAASVTESYLQGSIPMAPDAIATTGADLFGDKVNLYNGALTFEQTDLDLPGNSKLPVTLTRRHVASRHGEIQGQFGDWDLQAPSISGTFSAYGWITAASTVSRCSQMSAPPPAGPKANASFWQGNYLNVPGAGAQQVLTRASGYASAPGSNTSAYPLVTHGNWQIGCWPTVQNAAGEGFVAVSPSGVRYRFDWMARRDSYGESVAAYEHFLLATEVTDRFGNWVRYTYDANNPLLLTRIESNDGRIITIQNSGGRAILASDGTKTFTYAYSGAYGDLASVVQPDGGVWTFNLAGMRTPNLSIQGESANCTQPGLYDTDPGTGTMIHPSGAIGQFTNQFIYHGKTYVDRYCRYYSGTTGNTTGAVFPKITASRSIISKSISGPGIAQLNWSYGYAGASCWTSAPSGACTNQSDRKTVSITKPDGSVDRHIFGNRWHVNEGQLLQMDEGWNGTTALRTTTYRYRNPANQAYPEQFGVTSWIQADWLASRHRPIDQKVVTQQDTTFTWELTSGTAGLDGFARPLQSSQFSSLGYSKGETVAYFDQSANWVLGQVASITDQLGRVRESTSYNASTALPTAWYEFGRLVQSYEHHGDGNLYRVFDPLGRASTWTNYARGMAQNVTHRDGAQESAVINNLGKPTSHTNSAGTTTGYGYDAMGRLNRIDPPAEAGMAYHPILDVFEPVQAAEYGIGAGHWRQTTTTGNARTVRYYDALWRVGLTRTFDAANEAGTSRFVEFHYDPAGRKTFASQPQRNLSSIGSGLPGTTWFYDALGRTTAQRQDSELGNLDTVTEYLTGFQRKTTNARGYATTTAFQAFDVPSEDAPATIWAPEGVTVNLNRDTLGKPTAITRWGGGKSVTRSYVYDGYQRLCKTIEPESGATVQAYDGAGNVQWRASGQGLPGGSCDQGSVPAGSKVSFGYDARDRLVATSYGDGSPSVTRSYWPDGLLQQITTQHPSNPVVWNYSYNNRRLLTRERYTWDNSGAGWNFDWGVDAYGHVNALADPGGTVSYAPNALGEPTQVSGFATGVSYHPNGSIASYTLANGVTHSSTLNTRGLPLRMTNTGISQDAYAYDATGNITAITDEQENVNNRSMPQYDGLDRLRQANGPWGAGSYDYDALDNLVASTVGGRSLTHNMDAGTNRLTSLSGSQSIGIGYDVNGNVTQRGAQSFSFDIGNRMVNAPGKANYYLYDGHGRRNLVWFADGGWMHQAYTKDGKLRFGWRNTEGGTRHVYLGDKLIAEIGDSGVATFSHTDALGSPIAKTNSSGGLVSRTRYEPYGTTVAGSTNPTKVGFTGHVNDADTGLVYMQQRYYDPIAGRFLSVDPLITDAKTSSGFNRFAYAENNPFKYVDFDGQVAELFWTASDKVTLTVKYRTTGLTSPVSDAVINAQFAADFSGQVTIDGRILTITAQALRVEADGPGVNTLNIIKDTAGATRTGTSEINDIGGNRITIGATGEQAATGATISHEFGHAAGAGDQYAGGVSANRTRVLTDAPGRSNVMKDLLGKPANQQTLKEILKAPTNRSSCSGSVKCGGAGMPDIIQ